MEKKIKKKKRPLRFNNKMQIKLRIVFVIVILALIVLNCVLININSKKGDDYTIQVLNQQQYSSRTIPFKRGEIVDRNGNALATSIRVYNLVLDPKIMLSEDEYLEPTVDALVECFEELKKENLTSMIKEKGSSSYVVVLKQLEYEAVEKFQNIQSHATKGVNIQGVWFETEYMRKYPYETLACSVLGFTYDGNNADWGIEGYYNDSLNGVDGRQYGYMNNDNNMEKVIKEATDGNGLMSTLDVRIQGIVEAQIKAYNKEIKSKSISVLIMDPNTGEVLAMANDEEYDLNNPRDLSYILSKKEIKALKKDKDLEVEAFNKMWRNDCISDTFEAGSTIKPFTIAAALEEGLISEKDKFTCDGVQEVGGWSIKCHKNEGHGILDLSQTLCYSCNDALMQIGLKIDNDNFANYQSRFNFGKKTGLDLDGEAIGLLYGVDQLSEVTKATNSFGQNFTVNMVQVAAGYSSLVNGGYYYTPHVVKKISNEDGGLVENISDTVIKQTITSTTSKFINEALRSVVVDGSGRRAAIEGYEIGGKTGTAEKLPRGNGEYVLSFIGSVPYDSPEVVCYVMIDTPEEDPSNSGYASQLFNNIMTEVLPYMNIFKSGKSDKSTDKNKNAGEPESYDNAQDTGIPDTGIVGQTDTQNTN